MGCDLVARTKQRQSVGPLKHVSEAPPAKQNGIKPRFARESKSAVLAMEHRRNEILVARLVDQLRPDFDLTELKSRRRGLKRMNLIAKLSKSGSFTPRTGRTD
jgi:hypothetical protein